jgi:hypothetical protein
MPKAPRIFTKVKAKKQHKTPLEPVPKKEGSNKKVKTHTGEPKGPLKKGAYVIY